MTPNQWSNLRQYIDLTLEIREIARSGSLGDKRMQQTLERMRVQHSELETAIRESCDDHTTGAAR